MESERWLSIPGFEDYEVSSRGQIRHGDRVLRQTHARGHRQLKLRRGGRTFNKYVHRLVLLAFVGPPAADQEACHNNGVRGNNRLENLRWDTRRGNFADKLRHGTHNRGIRHPQSKLTPEILVAARSAAESGEKQRDIAKRLGVNQSTLSRALTGRTWSQQGI